MQIAKKWYLMPMCISWLRTLLDQGRGEGVVNLVVCLSGLAWSTWRHAERNASGFENGVVVLYKCHFLKLVFLDTEAFKWFLSEQNSADLTSLSEKACKMCIKLKNNAYESCKQFRTNFLWWNNVPQKFACSHSNIAFCWNRWGVENRNL